MDKIEVIETLKNHITEENKEKMGRVIGNISSKNEEELIQILGVRNIKTLEDLENFITVTLLKEEEKTEPELRELNNMVSYGVGGETIHIHLHPKDARNLLSRQGFLEVEKELIDAMEKVKEIIKNKEDIKQVYAVSGLIKGRIGEMLEKTGFDVKSMKLDDARIDEELKAFCEKFSDQRVLGRAVIDRENLLSDKWSEQQHIHKIQVDKQLNEMKKDDYER